MIGHDDVIECKHCGNGAHVNDMYDMIPFNDDCVIPVSPSRWVDEERKIIIKEIRDNPNYEYVENVKIGMLPKYKSLKNQATSEICGEGKIIINHSGFYYKGTRYGEEVELKLTYENLPTLGMVTDTSFCATYFKC